MKTRWLSTVAVGSFVLAACSGASTPGEEAQAVSGDAGSVGDAASPPTPSGSDAGGRAREGDGGVCSLPVPASNACGACLADKCCGTAQAWM